LLGGRIFPQYATRLFGLGIYHADRSGVLETIFGYAADRMPVSTQNPPGKLLDSSVIVRDFPAASWMKPVQDWPMLLRVVFSRNSGGGVHLENTACAFHVAD
jgi:hypothetical protein